MSKFGRNLGIALESEEIYKAIGEQELSKYKEDFRFFQKLRRSVKLRYSDGVDLKEYEPKMQKLMDNYISSDEIIRITNPVDILDEEGFEEELERLQTPRAKADSIRTRIEKRINDKWEEGPALYKKFSQRIKEILEAYRDARISESEDLKRMKKIRADFAAGGSDIEYTDTIRKNENAQAFYGVIKEIFSRDNGEQVTEEILGGTGPGYREDIIQSRQDRLA